jgi:hypothetical protein
MKTYWNSGGIAPSIVNRGTKWKWWSASSRDRFTPEVRAPENIR